MTHMAEWPTRGQRAPDYWDIQLQEYVDEGDAAATAAADAAVTSERVAEALAEEPAASQVTDQIIDTAARRGGTRVKDLVYPVIIAHRMGCNIYPENSLSAAISCAAVPEIDIIEYDVQAAADGSLIVMHDSTLDRTTTTNGALNTLSAAGARVTTLDASAWHAGRWSDEKVPLLGDILKAVGSRKIHLIEVKDNLDSTGLAMCKEIAAHGLQDYVIINSFSPTNVAMAASYGIAAGVDATSLTSPTLANIKSVGSMCVFIDVDTPGDLAGYVNTMHANGIKVFGFTVNQQARHAAALALGMDGVASNDPLYTAGNAQTGYRKSQTRWHRDGTWGPGMNRANIRNFNLSAANRAGAGGVGFVGGSNGFRWQGNNGEWFQCGEVTPVPNPNGTYTVDIAFGWDVVPTSTTEGLLLAFGVSSDEPTMNVTDLLPSYTIKARANGGINGFKVDGAGAVTGKGVITTTAIANPVTSGTLAAAVAVTSIPVTALTIALKTGHQFYLPNGQVATLSGAAAIGATALPVNSITPVVAVPSGTTLITRETVRVVVTPTQFTYSRLDEPSVAGSVQADSTYRGPFLFFTFAVSGAARISVESVTVT